MTYADLTESWIGLSILCSLFNNQLINGQFVSIISLVPEFNDKMAIREIEVRTRKNHST